MLCLTRSLESKEQLIELELAASFTLGAESCCLQGSLFEKESLQWGKGHSFETCQVILERKFFYLKEIVQRSLYSSRVLLFWRELYLQGAYGPE